MKKIIPALLVAAVFVGGMIFTYNYYYSGSYFYTKIDRDPISIKEDGDINSYTYQLDSYNSDGDKLPIELIEYRQHPLRKDALLKVLVNPNKGPLSWEEVTSKELPAKVKLRLSNE